MTVAEFINLLEEESTELINLYKKIDNVDLTGAITIEKDDDLDIYIVRVWGNALRGFSEFAAYNLDRSSANELISTFYSCASLIKKGCKKK